MSLTVSLNLTLHIVPSIGVVLASRICNFGLKEELRILTTLHRNAKPIAAIKAKIRETGPRKDERDVVTGLS